VSSAPPVRQQETPGEVRPERESLRKADVQEWQRVQQHGPELESVLAQQPVAQAQQEEQLAPLAWELVQQQAALPQEQQPRAQPERRAPERQEQPDASEPP